jgi:(+)-trans-carveol dehydrogenase
VTGRLEGKVAFVTGVARGQGRAHALRLAAEGAAVIGIDICEQAATVGYPLASAQDLSDTITAVQARGGRIVAEAADVRDEKALREVLGKGVSQFGRLDIVVANAAILNCPAPTWEVTVDQWQETLDVNLTGVWQTVRATVPRLLEQGQGGSVILISSALGAKGSPNLAPYVTAKHGVIGLMRTLALELAPSFVRVNAILPGNVDTPIIQNAMVRQQFLPGQDNPTREEFERANLAAKLAAMPVPWLNPEDISGTVAWLASDDSRFVTGMPISVDAGQALL